MVLGNKFIEQLGLEEQQINSASVDLTIGDKIIIVDFDGYEKKSSIIQQNEVNPYNQMVVDAREYEARIRHTEVDLSEFPEGVWIRPGVGILVSTEATVEIPDDVVGQVILKSSRGREFYQLVNAGYFDNGFKGQGTLQLYAPVVPILILPGMKMVQMVFHTLKKFDFTYAEQPTAKYQNQAGPTASKDRVIN